MAASGAKNDDFESALDAEVTLILRDPAFMRSPIQSKLLNFLRDSMLAGKTDLSQYDVAVDGLDRPEDFDLTNDSYPRVQVSRLRNNLAAYYAMNEPVGGGCVHIKPGEYQLSMGSRENAYPTKRAPAHPVQEAAAVPADQAGMPGAAQPVITQSADPAGFAAGALPSAAIAPAVAFVAVPHGEAGTAHPSAPILPDHQPQPAARRGMKKAAIGFVAGAATLAGVIALGGAASETRHTPLDPPIVGFTATADRAYSNSTASTAKLSQAKSFATSQLANSFVSRTAIDVGGGAETRNDYEIILNFALLGDRLSARLKLFNADGELIHQNAVPAGGDRQEFSRELTASLVYLTAPNGVIAQDQLKMVGETPRSAYECFLTIEGLRADGEAILPMMNSCIERFPDDRYASFWYSRRAFFKYQKNIMAGRGATMEGQAWADTLRALELDPYNAFANFVAAKVASANGQCRMARESIATAMAQGSSYPVLVAASLVEGSGCGGPRDELDREHDLTEALVKNSPNPDALLHIYLILSSLAIERPDLAKTMAGRVTLNSNIAAPDMALDQLQASLERPGYYAANKAQVDQSVERFIWSERARAKVAAAIAAAAPADG